MKKLTSILVALVLILSAASAFAAVPSKTTTDNTQVKTVESSTGVKIEESFAIEVAVDAAPVVKEIENLFTFVNEKKMAPIAYFPQETQDKVLEVLKADPAAVVDVNKLEINEIVTIKPIEYKEEYGDIKTEFAFVTRYAAGQKVVAMLSLYTGEVDANGEFIVEWVVLEAEVQADGSIAVVIPQAEMLKMQTAQSVALAVLSEAV